MIFSTSDFYVSLPVVAQEASCPIKYGLKLNMEDSFLSLRINLSTLSSIPADLLLVVEVYGSLVKVLLPCFVLLGLIW